VIRYHLDEHVDHAIAHGLRLRGIDVTTSTDAGLLGAADEAHVAFAMRDQRIIVTSDADFLRLARAGVDHPGIVYCVRGSRTVGYLVRRLCLLHDCMSPEEIYGRVEFL
jgi:predicted nuclease of predicted toxin-antitoxin system